MRILTNATFITLNSQDDIFDVLIEDKGKIIFTGNAVPKQYQNHPTIDLQGKTIIPAFGDTHLHFVSDSFFKGGLDLRGTTSYESLKNKLHAYELRTKSKITIGFGLSAHLLDKKVLPTKIDLDKITTRPTFIVKYDGHAGIGNTQFLKMIYNKVIKAKGLDYESGHFYLDSFYLATDFVSKFVSPITLLKNILHNCREVSRKGISFLHACEGVGLPFDLDVLLLQVLQKFVPQSISIFFQTTNLNKIKRKNFKRVGGCFETALDGCFGSEDAALTKPYTNNQHNSGNLYFSQEKLNDFVIRAHRNHLQVALHAIGDKAIEQAITAFEFAQKNYPRKDHRHVIIHACLLNDRLIERIANLDIHLAVQTAFLDWPEEPMKYLDSILGSRSKDILPLKKILDHHIMIANGSDAPCTAPDPLLGIHHACNHPNEEQSIGVIDALKMNTIWAARLGFEENIRGSLEPGKFCDLIMLDRNPLSIPKNTLKDLQIDQVIIKGKTVYTRDK